MRMLKPELGSTEDPRREGTGLLFVADVTSVAGQSRRMGGSRPSHEG